jgi:hypothetical protein
MSQSQGGNGSAVDVRWLDHPFDFRLSTVR